MTEREIKTESDLQQLIQIEAVQYKCHLLRNNSGAFKDETGRVVRFGLGHISKKQNERMKSSDLIGFKTEGGRAIFVAIEVKAPGWKYTGTKREVAQNNFLSWVRMNGGIGAFISSIEEFHRLMK